MKKLLIVVNVGWFLVSHRLPIALAAKGAGYDVHIAAALDPNRDQDTVSVLASHGITLHELTLSRRGGSLLDLLATFRELTSLFRSLRPSIIHLVTLKPVLIGGVAARAAGINNVVFAIPGRGTVFSARGFFSSLRRWGALLLYRLAYRRHINRIIVQNAEDRDYFVDRGIFSPHDVRLIRGSGVDLNRFRVEPEPPGEVVVVFASRMLKEKGVKEFVEAARILGDHAISARFVLVGEPDHGNPHSYSTEDLEGWQRSGWVEWWGYQRDMQSVFSRCHLVCLPTYYGEGVPKVLIEAASCGRPIVTTDMPGCRDIVRDGHNGFLVQPRDPLALSIALDRLISDRKLREEMGARGRALVEADFAVKFVVRSTLKVYQEFTA